jgi:hypothetical protein
MSSGYRAVVTSRRKKRAGQKSRRFERSGRDPAQRTIAGDPRFLLLRLLGPSLLFQCLFDALLRVGREREIDVRPAESGHYGIARARRNRAEHFEVPPVAPAKGANRQVHSQSDFLSHGQGMVSFFRYQFRGFVAGYHCRSIPRVKVA